jgi:hypothetical protein
MRLKLLMLVVVASLVGVSAAFGHGKPPGTGCEPNVTVVLKGTLGPDVDPADGDTSFVLTVLHTNRHGRAYKAAGTATVNVGPSTRVNRLGKHNLGELAPNDRVHVKAKACKADLKNGGTPDLTARKVDARPAPTP